MSRDQRVSDNWALIHAMDLARWNETRLTVVFALVPEFLGATLRQYDFMLRGLMEVEQKLRDLQVPFLLLTGDPPDSMEQCIRRLGAGTVVTDFDPLRIKRTWKNEVSKRTGVHMIEVDAHNIIPARKVSQKIEFGAYTLRPKIHRMLDQFLDEFPEPVPLVNRDGLPEAVDWEQVRNALRINNKVLPVDWIEPGEDAAIHVLDEFISERLDRYGEKRNDPNEDATSRLSPYLHFGQVAPQRVALEIIRFVPRSDSTDAFLEELIVRRELADNFCFYNAQYDTPKGFHAWAKQTHAEHAGDEREYLYTNEQFERSETHDPLWNAAQTEMVRTGRMHGYMRMYWAKKILEWTPDVAHAMQLAIYLNDTYQLDGRDPNGYTGIAWSMGGVHDRAWQERPVFGKVRYMNYNGCKRKFDVDTYIKNVNIQ
jgi:deoxyribodipyrimidine photo-lyase